MNYGLIKNKHLEEFAVAVCHCLGNGSNNNAYDLLLETAGAETNRGTIKDASINAGMGITQIDKMPFQDIKDRVKQSDIEKIYNTFGIDIDLVKWDDIRYNPFLCLLFTRLKYKKVPEIIPLTIEKRAHYWKEYYNTYAGKGTIEHYISANSKN